MPFSILNEIDERTFEVFASLADQELNVPVEEKDGATVGSKKNEIVDIIISPPVWDGTKVYTALNMAFIMLNF